MFKIRISRFKFFSALLLFGACAKTGDPLPSTVQLPPTINDLDVQRSGSSAQIRFRVPLGSEWIEVYRQCDPRTETDRIQLIVRLAPDELVETDQVDYFRYADGSVPPNAQVCRYALKFVDNRGQRSEFSNFAELPPP